MNDLNKIDSSRFFAFWKNFSVALLVMIITLFCRWSCRFIFLRSSRSSAQLSSIRSSITTNSVSLLRACSVLTRFSCVSSHSRLSPFSSMCSISGVHKSAEGILLFAEPYIPSLILNPICFLIILILKLRSGRLSICGLPY